MSAALGGLAPPTHVQGLVLHQHHCHPVVAPDHTAHLRALGDAGRQVDGHRDRKTDRQADRETEKMKNDEQSDGQTNRQTEIKSAEWTDTHAHSHKQMDKQKEIS